MFIVNAKTLPNTAESTILAVEDGLIGIREEMTDIAVIFSEVFATFLIFTVLSTRLDFKAVHAHHLLDGIAVDFMFLGCVMGFSEFSPDVPGLCRGISRIFPRCS